MADNSGNSEGGSNSGLAFIVGGLLVAVVVLAVVLFGSGTFTTTAPAGGDNRSTNLTRNYNVKVDPPKIEAPKIEVPAPAPAPAAPPAEAAE